MIPTDPAIEAQRVQTRLLRAMSFQQRLELMRELTLTVQHLAFAEFEPLPYRPCAPQERRRR